MWQNEILDEIHKIREEHAKSFNYDLDAMFADWQKKQAESGREVVRFSPKRPLIPTLRNLPHADKLKVMQFLITEIEIYNIATNSNIGFSAVVDMKANLQFAGIVTPLKWDAGKLFCEAKPEGKYKYWRITKLVKFQD